MTTLISFFSIVFDLVTSPLAECIRSQSTLQCRVSTVFFRQSMQNLLPADGGSPIDRSEATDMAGLSPLHPPVMVSWLLIDH